MELRIEWRQCMHAREALVAARGRGEVSWYNIVENDIAKLQWFVAKILDLMVEYERTTGAGK